MAERLSARTPALPATCPEYSGPTAHRQPPGFRLTADGIRIENPPVGPELAPPRENQCVSYSDVRRGPIAARGLDDLHAFAPSDVDQGSLGDCYFLAALASLAHSNPRLLANNITGPDESGQYQVRLYRRNEDRSISPVTILVNPRFPEITNEPNRRLAYAQQSEDRELWVLLYEKAYAQMLGSYRLLNEPGRAEDAMVALTGREASTTCIRIHCLDPNEMPVGAVCDEITRRIRAGQLVVANTTGTAEFGIINAMANRYVGRDQVIGKHAYSVMGCTPTQILLRNPHGGPYAQFALSWERFRDVFSSFAIGSHSPQH
jgi:Calpain family cysteine protease